MRERWRRPRAPRGGQTPRVPPRLGRPGRVPPRPSCPLGPRRRALPRRRRLPSRFAGRARRWADALGSLASPIAPAMVAKVAETLVVGSPSPGRGIPAKAVGAKSPARPGTAGTLQSPTRSPRRLRPDPQRRLGVAPVSSETLQVTLQVTLRDGPSRSAAFSPATTRRAPRLSWSDDWAAASRTSSPFP